MHAVREWTPVSRFVAVMAVYVVAVYTLAYFGNSLSRLVSGLQGSPGEWENVYD